MNAHPTAAELREAAPVVAAGVLAGDLADVGGAVRALEAGGARVLHLDVGDGRYSPLMLGGPDLVSAVRTRAYKDVHLMVDEPLRHLRRFVRAGADALTVQLDGGRHLLQCLREIGASPSARHSDRPVLRGVGLPLDAQIGALAAVLDEVDLVLVLGVVPGHRGVMAPRLCERVRAVRRLLDRDRPEALLSVDGGVTAETAPALAAEGADLIVSASALFQDGQPARALAAMTAAVRAGQAPGARQSGASDPSAASGSIPA